MLLMLFLLLFFDVTLHDNNGQLNVAAHIIILSFVVKNDVENTNDKVNQFFFFVILFYILYLWSRIYTYDIWHVLIKSVQMKRYSYKKKRRRERERKTTRTWIVNRLSICPLPIVVQPRQCNKKKTLKLVSNRNSIISHCSHLNEHINKQTHLMRSAYSTDCRMPCLWFFY